MNKLSVLVIVFLSIALPATAQIAKQRVLIEQEIRTLDAAHADAILRGDLAALDKIWTTDFKVNNPFNEVDNAKRISTGAVTYSSFERVAETFLIHGKTVIVMGRETAVPKGNSPDTRALFVRNNRSVLTGAF